MPIFSAGDVSPSCILSCYSLLHAESVPFVVNFVQKAVRLLWDGLDQIDPHESVGKVLWNNVGPSDLGEMAADVEMQKAFIGKKRPRSDMNRRPSVDMKDYPAAARPRCSSEVSQMNDIPHFDTGMQGPLTAHAAPPAQGLSPAPLFPTTVMAPNSQQMVPVNFLDNGHWAVQQAVKSVGEVQLWNSTQDVQQFSNGVQHQHVYHQDVPDMQQQQHQQPLQYHPEFTAHAGFDQGQQQFSSFLQNSNTQNFPLQPNHSLAYVDYGQPQSVEANSNPIQPPLPAGIHIDPQPVIQANLMEFNAMAQMYSNPETSHPPNNKNGVSMNYNQIPQQLMQAQPIENFRVVPLSHAEGSVILTGPQQLMYCTNTAQPVNVESMDQHLFSLNTVKVRHYRANVLRYRIVKYWNEFNPRVFSL